MTKISRYDKGKIKQQDKAIWILRLTPQYDKAMAQHDNKIRQYDKFRRFLNLSKSV